MRSLADKAGLQTACRDDELDAVAGHINQALSVLFVGLRRNDRATAATGEVQRWALALHHATMQQRVGLGFEEGAASDHRLSAFRYLAHAFGHDTMPEATRAVVSSAAERLGARPGASPAELVRIAYERADDVTTIFGVLSGITAAIASVAPRSKPEADLAIRELFDDLLIVFEALHARRFTIASHARPTIATTDREQRPEGPVLNWIVELFSLVSDRAVSSQVGVFEMSELKEWAQLHPDGVFRAVHAARRRKMQREKQ